MQLSTRVQNEIKKEFVGHFGARYSFDDIESVPQGQNNYSSNFIIQSPQNRKYLLKVLLLDKIPQSNRRQAQTEIDICKKVSSPYIARLVDYMETKKYAFLIFPFIEGQNLEQYARTHGQLQETRVKEISIGILRGIADIHRNSNGNVIHQDLKPENILITPNDEVFLLDFGAARYKQSPFRGNARHNFAYSSREQIRASRPNCMEELRITLSDKADVFSAGLIIYRLLEGKHPHQDLQDKLPADAILESRSIPIISRDDISEGMKKILGRMLEYEPLNRFNAQESVAAFEQGDIQPLSLENGKFFYCAASSTGRFVKLKNKYPYLFDGLIVEASQLPTRQNKVAEIHTNIKTVIIDPQTYFFQKPEAVDKKFKNLSYYDEALFSNPANLIQKITEKDSSIKDFIKKVFQHQIENGADVLVAPYFYIPEFNDDFWTIDQEITKLSEEIYQTLSIAKPLIKGVSISEDILGSAVSRNRILEYLQSLYGYNGFLVLLESSHQETITNENWLKDAKEFFAHLLATQKFVIWSRADLFGLALAGKGLSIAIGEFQKQRKFNICVPRQNWGRRGKFFYLSAMFARILWPEGFRALNRYDERDQLVCLGACCSGINFNQFTRREEEDLAFHLMVTLRAQFDAYTGKNGNKNLERDIKRAIGHYDKLKKHPDRFVRLALKNNIKPNSSNFLSSWANALGI